MYQCNIDFLIAVFSGQLSAPDGYLKAYARLKETAETLLKINKTMGQTSVSSPADFEMALDKALELGIRVPGHFFVHLFRVMSAEKVKFGAFHDFAELFAVTGQGRKKLIDSGMTNEAPGTWPSSILELVGL